MLRLYEPYVGLEEREALLRVFDSKLWAAGAVTKEFERQFAGIVGYRYAVSVDSGTNALFCAVVALRTGNALRGVSVPSLTFAGTASAMGCGGLRLKLLDVGEDLCLKGGKVETDVVVPVHYGGCPCDLDALGEYKFVIEDCAHAVGTRFGNRRRGVLSCFSVSPVKNLASPAGGVVCTNEKGLVDALLAIRGVGRVAPTFSRDYDVGIASLRFEWNDLAAAVALEQLKRLPVMLARRRALACLYDDLLEGKRGVGPLPRNREESSNHLMVVQFDKPIDQFELIGRLANVGVEARVHYKPLHELSLYKGGPWKLPYTDKIKHRILSLPMHPGLSDEDVKYIMDNLLKVM